LARSCHFDDRDRQRINRRQSAHTRLGFAIQLGTVRFLGTFLPNPTAVPENVVTYVAHQLRVEDPDCLSRYASRDTHWDHATQMQHAYGYHDFDDPRETCRLVRWL
jgi:hypothetical protein